MVQEFEKKKKEKKKNQATYPNIYLICFKMKYR